MSNEFEQSGLRGEQERSSIDFVGKFEVEGVDSILTKLSNLARVANLGSDLPTAEVERILRRENFRRSEIKFIEGIKDSGPQFFEGSILIDRDRLYALSNVDTVDDQEATLLLKFYLPQGPASVSALKVVDIDSQVDSIRLAENMSKSATDFTKNKNFKPKPLVIDMSEVAKTSGSTFENPQVIDIWDPEIHKTWGDIEDENNLFILAGFEKLSYAELLALFNYRFEKAFEHFQEQRGRWGSIPRKANLLLLIVGRAENAYAIMNSIMGSGVGTLDNFWERLIRSETIYIKRQSLG